MLKVIPAIDIRNGNVVRLFKGLYNKETIYSENPVEFAKKWKDQGADILHVVDLDGAFYGELKNISCVEAIIKETGLNVHLGGGIRSKNDIERVINAGVKKAIMSTKVFSDKNFLMGLPISLKESIIVSIDIKAGLVLGDGWTSQSNITIKEALNIAEGSGIKTCVITDISQDGTLKGPNIELLKEIAKKSSMSIIAAGGVSSIEDIKKISALKDNFKNIYGAIIGKALYENKIDLKEAIDCAS